MAKDIIEKIPSQNNQRGNKRKNKNRKRKNKKQQGKKRPKPQFFQEDVVELRKKGQTRVGVIQSLYEQDEMDDDYSDEELKPHQCRVTWSSGKDEVINKKRLQLVDRSFMHGDIVLKDIKGSSGTVIDVNIFCSLKFFFGRKEIKNVHHQHIKLLHLFRNYAVYDNNWLCQIDELSFNLVVKFSDNSVCILRDVTDEIFDDMDLLDELVPFFPSMPLKFNNSERKKCLRNGHWVKGKYNPRAHKSGLVINVVPSADMELDFLTCRDVQSNQNRPDNIDLRKLVPFSYYTFSSLNVGDHCIVDDSFFKLTPEQRKQPPKTNLKNWRDTTINFTSEKWEDLVVDHSRHSCRLVRTQTFVDVQWQDGSIERNIPAISLRPKLHVDAVDHFVHDIVRMKDLSLEEDKKNMYGVVESVDYKSRIANVIWKEDKVEPVDECKGKAKQEVVDTPEEMKNVEQEKVDQVKEVRKSDAIERVDEIEPISNGKPNTETPDQVSEVNCQKAPAPPARTKDIIERIDDEAPPVEPQPQSQSQPQSHHEGEPIVLPIQKIPAPSKSKESETISTIELEAHPQYSFRYGDVVLCFQNKDWVGEIIGIDGDILTVCWASRNISKIKCNAVSNADEILDGSEGSEDLYYGSEDEEENIFDLVTEFFDQMQGGEQRGEEQQGEEQEEQQPPRRMARRADSDEEDDTIRKETEKTMRQSEEKKEEPPKEVKDLIKKSKKLRSNCFIQVESIPDFHFKDKSVPNPSKRFLKAIRKDWILLRKELPKIKNITVIVPEDNLCYMRAIITGIEGTPYNGGVFVFDFFLPETYPDEPPLAFFHSYEETINPNLYQNGKICLSLLHTWKGEDTETWSENSNLFQLLLSLMGIVLNADPYFNEAGYDKQADTKQGVHNASLYNESAVLFVLNHLIKTLRHPMGHTQSVIADHLQRNTESILNPLELYLSQDPKKKPPTKYHNLQTQLSSGFLIPLKKKVSLLKKEMEAFQKKYPTNNNKKK